MYQIIFITALSITHVHVEKRIIELQPNIDRTYAHELAVEVTFWAAYYKCDPMLTVAIAMQESSLNPEAVSPTGDVTVFQLSPQTVKAYHLDAHRLKHDVAYQVQAHFRILSDKLDRCRGPRGWSCYHSATVSRRNDYERLVMRYYKSPKAHRVVRNASKPDRKIPLKSHHI
jgi:hypothetical protein